MPINQVEKNVVAHSKTWLFLVDHLKRLYWICTRVDAMSTPWPNSARCCWSASFGGKTIVIQRIDYGCHQEDTTNFWFGETCIDHSSYWLLQKIGRSKFLCYVKYSRSLWLCWGTYHDPVRCFETIIMYNEIILMTKRFKSYTLVLRFGWSSPHHITLRLMVK